MTFSRAATITIAFTAVVLAGTVVLAAAVVDTERTEGWLRSGRSLSMGGLVHRQLDVPEGHFETFVPAGRVRAILASGDSVWVGSEGGLFIWLPAADTIFHDGGPGLVSVTSLATGVEGELWVGGDDGLSVRRTRGWQQYTARDHPFFSDITDIRYGEGRLWISTWGHGCGYVSGDTLTILTRADSLLDNRVTCVVEQSDHTIWIGTESGVCRADSFSWTSMRYGSRLPVGRVRDIIQTEEGNLFVSVARQGVARYSLGRISRYGPGQGLPDREIYRFGLDSEAKVWAVGQSGVSTWDGSGWTPLRMPGISLAIYDFLSLDHDPEGIAYLGTSSGVLLAMARDSYREIQLPSYGPGRMIGCIESTGGSLVMTGGSAVFSFNGGFTRIGLPGECFEGALTGVIPQRAGGMWLSTRFGILHYTGDSWEVFDRRQGLPTEHFTSAALGKDGGLWFGTFDCGVLRLTGGGWVHYRQQHGLPDESISSLVVDRSGAAWVSTQSGRVARFEGEGWETIVIPGAEKGRGESIAQVDSLFPNDPAVRIIEQQGKLQEGSFAPLIGLDGSGRCMICIESAIYFQSEAGWRVIDIPSNGPDVVPTVIEGMTDGSIWLGTSGSGAYVRREGRWLHVDSTTGLGDDHILAIEEDGSGKVWIGTRFGGITRYSLEH